MSYGLTNRKQIVEHRRVGGVATTISTPSTVRAVPITTRQNVVEGGVRRTLIVAGVMAAALMQTLDQTITNVALPTIQGNLGASQDEATWVITAYTIASIVVIPLTPWLQNRFGRRNYFVTSVVGFTIASVACGAAPSLSSLVIARVVQGAFGGGLLATAQSILRDTFPPQQLGLSQGIFALGAIMGPALGPPIGGVLVDNWSWNWCFDINVVPGIFATVVLFLFLRDPEKGHATPVDFVGLPLLAVALGSMQYVLTEGEQHYWLQDGLIAFMTLVCLVTSFGFVVYELRGTKYPVVDIRILANRTVAAGLILAFALGVASLGSTYVLPQLTQDSLGFTPTLSGLLFLLRAIPIALCTPLIVRYSGRIDARIMLATGFLLVTAANVMQAFITTSESGFSTFALPLILSGCGSAMLWIPLTIAVLGATTPQDGPKAAAFINLGVQLGGSAAVAILDVIVHQREQFHSTILAGNLTLADPAVQAFLRSHSLTQLGAILYDQSSVLSYADASFAIGGVALICTPLIFLMRRGKGAQRSPEIAIEA